MATEIKYKAPKPTNVSSMTKDKDIPNRYGVTWKIPSSGSSSTSASRWEVVYYTWRWWDPDKTADSKWKKWVNTKWEGVRGPANKTSSYWTIPRGDFYPTKGKPRLTKLRFDVQPSNSCGSYEATIKTYDIEKPTAPKVTYEYDEDTGIVTIKLNMKQSGHHDRYVTDYTVWRKDTGLKSTRYKDGKWHKALGPNGAELSAKNVKANTVTLTHNIEISIMPPGASIELCVTSVSRGFAGDTEVKIEKAPSYTIKPPDQIAISKVVVQDKALGKTYTEWSQASTRSVTMVYYKHANGKASAKYNTQDPTEYELQRLVTDAGITKAQANLMEWPSTPVDKNTGSTSEVLAKTVADKKNNKQDNQADAVMGEPTIDVIAAMMTHKSTDGVPYDCKVWYRVKAIRQGLVEYSAPFCAKPFTIAEPSADGDKAAFCHISSGDNGTAINTLIGWSNPNNPDEGIDTYPDAEWTTEASWSKYSDAWTSTEKPETFLVDWKDSNSDHNSRLDQNGYIANDINPQNKRVKWEKTAELSIKGLEVGTPYYLRLRRHMKLGDIEDYGPYTSAPKGYWPFTPTDTPSEVKVNVNGPLVMGESLRVSWSHNAVSKITSWAVYIVEIPTLRENTGDSSLPKTVPAKQLRRKLLKSGEKDTDYTIIKWKTLVDNFPQCKAYDGNNQNPLTIDTSKQIGIGVSIATGGVPVDSYANADGKYCGLEIVEVVSKATHDVFFNETLTSQDDSFLIFTDSYSVEAQVNIIAKGITIPLPGGDIIQAEDDYVWSKTINETLLKPVTDISVADFPSGQNLITLMDYLTEYSDGYYWSVDLPGGLELYDGAEYYIEVTCVSTIDELLKSDTTQNEFKMDYEHQAHVAGPMSRCEVRSKSDFNGGSSYVEIYLQKPDNWVSTDRCNVYRVTPDKAYLIADDVEFERTVIDRYPPFSKVANLRYALVTVTKDKDFETKEVPYALRRHGLRFDWGTQISKEGESSFVELPYDIELTDAFEKDSEVRRHMDGEDDAYFNRGVARTGSISTKLVKLSDPEQFEKIRELAQYPGTALCRAHDGTCYEAVVDVTGIENKYDSLVAPIKITTREVGLTRRFMSTSADIRKVIEPWD